MDYFNFIALYSFRRDDSSFELRLFVNSLPVPLQTQKKVYKSVIAHFNEQYDLGLTYDKALEVARSEK